MATETNLDKIFAEAKRVGFEWPTVATDYTGLDSERDRELAVVYCAAYRCGFEVAFSADPDGLREASEYRAVGAVAASTAVLAAIAREETKAPTKAPRYSAWLEAIRADKVVGNATCSPIAECYSDADLVELFSREGVTTKRQALAVCREIDRAYEARFRSVNL